MDEIAHYFELASERPELFRQSERIPLVLDETRMREFSQESGRPMGVVYDNTPYYLVLADLRESGGRLFSYARVIYPERSGNGAVLVVKKAERFALLSIFRHPPRAECAEFPRGFAEAGLSPEENARKELREELGAEAMRVELLGEVSGDTGLSAGKAQVFLAEIGEEHLPCGHEGIHGLRWLTEDELTAAIRAGTIQDGFTLSAYALYRVRRDAAL